MRFEVEESEEPSSYLLSLQLWRKGTTVAAKDKYYLKQFPNPFAWVSVLKLLYKFDKK